jgi:hypothetical protein
LTDFFNVEGQEMRAKRIAIPSAIVLGGLLVCTSSMFGTAEYSKKEKKACTVCHGKVSKDKAEMVKNLTTTGTCYKDNDHSLEKCASKK